MSALILFGIFLRQIPLPMFPSLAAPHQVVPKTQGWFLRQKDSSQKNDWRSFLRFWLSGKFFCAKSFCRIFRPLQERPSDPTVGVVGRSHHLDSSEKISRNFYGRKIHGRKMNKDHFYGSGYVQNFSAPNLSAVFPFLRSVVNVTR